MTPHRDRVRYLGIKRIVTRYCHGPFQDAVVVASYIPPASRSRGRRAKRTVVKTVAARYGVEYEELSSWRKWAKRRALHGTP